MKNKDYSIELLKFFAALLIINSHLGTCYGQYVSLATGGAIGNSLFMFCSGFTILLGRTDRFDNWYKRRIMRIFPSVFAIMLISSLFVGAHYNVWDQLVVGGGWFVECIMFFYIAFYIIKRFLLSYIKQIFLVVILVLFVWYFIATQNSPVEIINASGVPSFAWLVYFSTMLLGAIIGIDRDKFNFKPKRDLFFLFLSIGLYYGFLTCCNMWITLSRYQILSVVPLYSILYFFYRVCNAPRFLALTGKKVGIFFLFISSLCLETYLVQTYFHIFTYDNRFEAVFPFPLNVIMTYLAIIGVAYVVKVVSILFTQTFDSHPYDWIKVFKIW